MTTERSVPKMAAVWAIIWGAFVANPWTCIFAKNPVIYEPMLSIVNNENLWGLSLIIWGVLSLIATYKDKKALASLFIAIPFFSLAVLYLLADPESPAWGLWGWMAVYNLTIAWDNKGWKWKGFQKG
jgi:hypothetical protein